MKTLMAIVIGLFFCYFDFGERTPTTALPVKQSAPPLSKFASDLSDTMALSKLLQDSTTEKLGAV